MTHGVDPIKEYLISTRKPGNSFVYTLNPIHPLYLLRVKF